MDNVLIRPATKQDIIDLYGEAPARTMKAYAAEWKGKVVGVAGLYYLPDQVVAFSKVVPSDAPKHGLARGVLKLLALLRKTNKPVFAVAEKTIPTSRDLLMRCGFVPLGQTLQGEVFIWQPQ